MKEIILDGLDEKILEYTTKSGLKVYMWINEKVNGCFMSLSVKYGSIHTKFKINKKVYTVPKGIAHFLEHIKFNMSNNTTAHDEFKKLGGDANAFTTFKYTSYIVFATQKKIENLNVLLDFVFTPYFNKSIVKKEKGIIIEETNMVNDDPYSKMFYDCQKNIFQKSQFRDLITGEVEDIKKISLEDIDLVYKNFYHPKNMFLTVTGNFNPYEVIKAIEDNLKSKEFNEFKLPEIISDSEPRKVTKDYSETEVNISYPRIKYALKIPITRFKNIDSINLKLYTELLFNMNFGATSSLQSELEIANLISHMGYYTDIYDDYIVASITANTSYPEEVIRRLQEKIDDLQIDENDIVRKKNAAIATLILDYEDIEQVNMKIQNDIINEGYIVTDLKKRLSSVTKESLQDVAKYINNDVVSINVFKPQENQEN